MTPRRRRAYPAARARITSAIALATALFVGSGADAHPFDSPNADPRTYAEAVHGIRDELRAVRQSIDSGADSDLERCTTHLGTLAAAVPTFLWTLKGALVDSAAGPILRASTDVAAAARAMRLAVQSGDRNTLAALTSRCAEPLAVLDLYVPKQYVCSMHCEPGRTYDRPGSCPVCGMHLQLVTSDRYSVEVSPIGGALRARVPSTLEFQIRDPAGFDVESLQVVHEKLLHLMIVSQDLSSFAHVHPIRQANGRFRLRHTFKAAGPYVLFHDFTPNRVGMQVVPVGLTVAGAEPDPAPLAIDDGRPKRVDGYDVVLHHAPLTPNVPCTLTFTLTRRGRPVIDLEPFLGAAGHLVAISQDRAVYVHSHPIETTPSLGPSVEFQVTFSRTGLYKMWGQFQRHGHVVTVPFVVEVSPQAPTPSPDGTALAR